MAVGGFADGPPARDLPSAIRHLPYTPSAQPLSAISEAANGAATRSY
jgi:hypothetical protein